MLRQTIVRLFGLVAGGVLAGALAVGAPGPAAPLAQLDSLAPPPADPALLRLLSALSPNTRVLSAVERDVDRDGDLDVIATTPKGVVAWLNDDRGHFAPQEFPATSRMNSSPELNDPSGHASAQATVPAPDTKGAWLRTWTRATPAASAGDAVRSTSIDLSRQCLDTGPGRAPPLRASLA